MSEYISAYFVLCVNDRPRPPPLKTNSDPGKTLCALAMCWPIIYVSICRTHLSLQSPRRTGGRGRGGSVDVFIRCAGLWVDFCVGLFEREETGVTGAEGGGASGGLFRGRGGGDERGRGGGEFAGRGGGDERGSGGGLDNGRGGGGTTAGSSAVTMFGGGEGGL